MASQGDTETGREHEVGVLVGPLLKFNLEEEMQQLRSEGRWQSGHTAKTLAKYPDFRVVLVVMKTGGRLEKHRTEGRISVHALAGSINFSTAEQSVQISAGQMLTLEREIPHDVEAITDSAFLLTIAWPAQTLESVAGTKNR
jgi:quercetin dioxygenase-like cupin family protein